LLLVLSGLAFAAPTHHASAINLTQAEAPIALVTTAPQPGTGGVVNADTAGGPAAASGPNPVLVLLAALGVLVGVLIITRPRRRGPD
jgi:hypothetical protein